jgi:hypothetical protein
MGAKQALLLPLSPFPNELPSLEEDASPESVARSTD